MNWRCNECGTENGAEHTFCSKCFEVRPSAGDAVLKQFTATWIPAGAGFWIRFLARFIDFVYLFAIALVTGLFTGIFLTILSRLGKLTPQWPQLMRANTFSISGISLGILAFFFYHAFAEGLGSVTVGKLICGLRVVQANGGPATFRGALIRGLGYHVDALFFGLVGYASMEKGRLRQRFGDVWGRTVVVKSRIFQPQPARGGVRVAAGIVLGSAVSAAVFFLETVIKVL